MLQREIRQMDEQQRFEFLGRTPQVFGREQPDRDVRDTGLAAPFEQVRDVPRAHDVALAHVVESGGPGPASIAVDHDRDVLGHRQADEVTSQAPLVDRVDGVAQAHSSNLSPSTTPAGSTHCHRWVLPRPDGSEPTVP